jgi:hypothetical protein
MTDQEILEIDFYDLCGCAALWMSDEDKIKYYRECMNTPCRLTANVSGLCVIALSSVVVNFKFLLRATTQSPCYVPLNLEL